MSAEAHYHSYEGVLLAAMLGHGLEHSCDLFDPRIGNHAGHYELGAVAADHGSVLVSTPRQPTEPQFQY